MQHFEYKLTRTIRNGQVVRSKYEIEWQTTEQSQRANKFLYEVLANRNTIQNVTSRTEIRPIPAQWKHFMQVLFEKEAFHEFIQASFCKFLCSLALLNWLHEFTLNFSVIGLEGRDFIYNSRRENQHKSCQTSVTHDYGLP